MNHTKKNDITLDDMGIENIHPLHKKKTFNEKEFGFVVDDESIEEEE